MRERAADEGGGAGRTSSSSTVNFAVPVNKASPSPVVSGHVSEGCKVNLALHHTMRSQGSRSQGVQEGDLEDFQPETRRSAWNTTM